MAIPLFPLPAANLLESLDLICSADLQQQFTLAGLRHFTELKAEGPLQRAAESLKRRLAIAANQFLCFSLPLGRDFLRSSPCQRGGHNKMMKMGTADIHFSHVCATLYFSIAYNYFPWSEYN
jgi:hypothetical protein